jgi:hypothetical protein
VGWEVAVNGLTNLQLGLVITGFIAFIALVEEVGGYAGVGLLLLGIGGIGVAALRWGFDSRDGRDWKPIQGAGRRAARARTQESDGLPQPIVDAVIERMEGEFRR